MRGGSGSTTLSAFTQVLEDTLEALFGRSAHVVASGRTDTGVHAWGQVASFDLEHGDRARPAEKGDEFKTAR
ncbi:MAG: hypothetical protein ACLR23_22410 [Clostridia bacterium]